MPTIDSIQAAVPCCPGITSNLTYGRTHRQPCGRAMTWDHGHGFWACLLHGPRLDGAEAAANLHA